MPHESPLTIGEFERATDRQTKLFMTEFGRVHTRLDGLGDRTAAVETRLDERAPRSMKAKAGWSTVAAGVGIIFAKFAEKLWTK